RLCARSTECPAVLDAAVIAEHEIVHDDFNVWEGRDERLRYLGDACRVAVVDGNRAARDVVGGHLLGIAAAPRLCVRARELLDLLPVVGHRLGRPSPSPARRRNARLGQRSGMSLEQLDMLNVVAWPS